MPGLKTIKRRDADGRDADGIDSEKANAFLPLGISSLSVAPSPSAHVFAVLDSAKEADEKGLSEGLYGKDVMVWGGNGTSLSRSPRRSEDSLTSPSRLATW